MFNQMRLDHLCHQKYIHDTFVFAVLLFFQIPSFEKIFFAEKTDQVIHFCSDSQAACVGALPFLDHFVHIDKPLLCRPRVNGPRLGELLEQTSVMLGTNEN